jgi:phage tail protein X
MCSEWAIGMSTGGHSQFEHVALKIPTRACRRPIIMSTHGHSECQQVVPGGLALSTPDPFVETHVATNWPFYDGHVVVTMRTCCTLVVLGRGLRPNKFAIGTGHLVWPVYTSLYSRPICRGPYRPTCLPWSCYLAHLGLAF